MKAQYDIVCDLDSGRCVMLVLLDTSAAFNTSNRPIVEHSGFTIQHRRQGT